MSTEDNLESFDPGKCPLCRRSNDCQLCTTAAYKGPCWCSQINMPRQLLAQVPLDLRNRACICRECVTEFQRTQAGAPSKLLPGDFYFESGLLVFTAAYHLRRGFCCGSGCRHCPYPPSAASARISA